MIRGARAAKRAPSWQDIRAVYPPAAVCGAFRMHGAHILPKPAHFGCTARISCQEGAIFPPEAPFGIHGVKKLPRIAARERISRAFCHRQAHGNAPWQNLATNRHLGGRTARVYCRCQSGQERIRAQSRHRRTLENAFREHFANRAASSCGRAYCLAIALTPHESDDLFVQAVLCTRERGATSCAWRRLIVAMAGNRTEGRGTLSRTWRGALNAGIRAEGADDKLAHALHPSRLAPFAQADLLPSTNRPQHRCETRNEPAGQANIERLRETGLRDRRRSGIAGNGVHRPAAGSQDGFAHWNSPEQFARQGHAPGFTRTARKLSSRASACGGGQSRSGVARRNSRVDPARRVSRAQKSAAPKNGALPRTTTGANQIRPES